MEELECFLPLNRWEEIKWVSLLGMIGNEPQGLLYELFRGDLRNLQLLLFGNFCGRRIGKVLLPFPTT
jgi:hypothetical protein